MSSAVHLDVTASDLQEDDVDDSTELEDCDIVMKGGITSGVVYPSAIRELSTTHRFRNIGGASVGAIAAAMTAAAEYGRQTGKGTAFREFDVIDAELVRDGFLLALFVPRPEARGVYAIYLAIIRKAGAIRLGRAVLSQAPWVIPTVMAWWLTLAITAVSLGERWWIVPVLVIGWGLLVCAWIWSLERRANAMGLAGFLLPILWPTLFAVPSIGLRAWRDLSENGFGLVPGASDGDDGLCDWLHRHIQAAAGLPDDQPLTFGMLLRDLGKDGRPVEIDLQMMTTNLSTARPMRVPRELDGYAFNPPDLHGVLPSKVLALLEREGKLEGDVIRLPAEDRFPVLLGFRLSLSFPLLFTAVRLAAPALETKNQIPSPTGSPMGESLATSQSISSMHHGEPDGASRRPVLLRRQGTRRRVPAP
jgi:hypothetical protein